MTRTLISCSLRLWAFVWVEACVCVCVSRQDGCGGVTDRTSKLLRKAVTARSESDAVSAALSSRRLLPRTYCRLRTYSRHHRTPRPYESFESKYYKSARAGAARMRAEVGCWIALAHLCLLCQNAANGAEQRIRLSDSYLPAALQVIAHLVDQMAYETGPATAKPSTAKPPTAKPPSKPGGSKPEVSWDSQNGGWSISILGSSTETPIETTTPFHKPGLFQGDKPPAPGERQLSDPLYRSSSPLDLQPGELNEESLQYLSTDVREVLRLAQDPDDPRAVHADLERAAPNKQKLSQSNLRLLLLHDLLSREAKRLKLNEFGGFSPSVARALDEAGAGGARAQLRLALSRMVERKDSEHEYANNRAKEMVSELQKDESVLSAETRQLQPLRYHL